MLVPDMARVAACALCVPSSRSTVKVLAYLLILVSIAIAIMIWFTTLPALVYTIFGLSILLAVLGGYQAFFLTIRCGPCACG